MSEFVEEEILTIEEVTEFVTDSVPETILTLETVTVYETEQITETQTVQEALETFAVELVTETITEVESISEYGQQGPPGPPGPSGNLAQTVSRLAGEALGGSRVVYVAADGTFRYADSQNDSARSIAGVTLGAAILGATATAQYAGELVEPSWAWTPEFPVFLSTNGLLSQSEPVSGIVVTVGVATGTDRILVRIGVPIFL